MSTENIIVFDTETTGTDPQEDQVIEIAIQSGLGPDAEMETQRFKPSVPIKPAAQAVHGISIEDLKDCPPFLSKAILERFSGGS